MPRWAGQADAATTAYWTGTDTAPAPNPAAAPAHTLRSRRGDSRIGEAPKGPEIGDMTQLLGAVALGQAAACVPVSIVHRHNGADLAFVPVMGR